MPLGRRLRVLSVTLFVMLLAVWAVFYMALSHYLQNQTREMTRQIHGYMLGELESRFAGMEQLSRQLMASSAVETFLSTDDTPEYMRALQEVSDSLLLEPAGFMVADNLILFRRDGAWFRFRGGLSGADCERAHRLVSRMPLKRHAVLELGDGRYLGYGNRVPLDSGGEGVILMLLDRDKLFADMMVYAAGSSVQVALAADGEIVVATEQELLGSYAGARAAGADYSVSQRIRNTPFEVIVFSEGEYHSEIQRTFLLFSLLTLALLGLAICLFLFLLNRQLFGPIVETIRNIEAAGAGDTTQPVALPAAGGVELTRLIDRFNSMLKGLAEKDRAVYEADLRRQQAEIFALKKQINAHFTINVLNVIKRMSSTGDTDAALGVIDALSHIIRYAYSEEDSIGVLDEMFMLEQYVEIMRYRYSGNIVFDYEIDERLYDFRLPRMLLQPLVENAILHGFEAPMHRGRVCVSVEAAQEGGAVLLTVEDDGRGMKPAHLEELRRQLEEESMEPTPPGISGVALRNIHMRLHAYYGEGAGIRVDSRPGAGTRVTQVLPVRQDEIER